jgi:hypothetical protein
VYFLFLRRDEEADSRYKEFFYEFNVDVFVENQRGKTFFLIEGAKA